MTSLDFLLWALGIGFIILVVFLSYTLYTLTKTLQSLKEVIEDAQDLTQDVTRLKNSLKLGIFSLLGKFIKKRR